jgi:proteasome assembly chaperone (PAC2) family protein
MASTHELRDAWLVAVWPGMGNVALGAGSYLVQKLGAQLAHELPARDLFDIQSVEVKEGVAGVGRLPRCMFFEWHNPAGRQDLIIFIGEAQLAGGGYAFCHQLLDYAVKRGAKRLLTFAAMATQLHPSHAPRVFAVATENGGLEALNAYNVEILKEGQISGLNGVLLAAGAERGLPGACLLGELPFFAAGVPNPKASQAVLQVFAEMVGIELDFTELATQAEAVEQGLLELLEKMKEAARQQTEAEETGFTVSEFTQADPEDEQAPPPDEEPAMFEDAHQDRTKAFRLKAELDRLGVFEQYEDRFLDLFKKAD